MFRYLLPCDCIVTVGSITLLLLKEAEVNVQCVFIVTSVITVRQAERSEEKRVKEIYTHTDIYILFPNHPLWRNYFIWCGFDRASSLICGNKMPTRCNRWFLLQILLLAQHVSGTTMPIIRSSRVLYKGLLPVVLVLWFSSCRYGVERRVMCPVCWLNLKTKTPNTTGSNHLYNTLELLMMGIVVPETCWASNKICNKNHLLHLVGILFPHINDDTRSKPY